MGKLLKFDKEGIAKAAEVVKRGGVIAYPTDTVYGIGCDPKNSEAVDRLFSIKEREKKPIPILCDSLGSAAKIVRLNGIAMTLAKKYWPGALTIVVPMKAELPFQIHQGTGTVGVRVPGLELCIELIHMCGSYLAGTSANKSGKPSCKSAEEVASELGEEVDVILDGGHLREIESTVVSFAEGKVVVLRKGSVDVV